MNNESKTHPKLRSGKPGPILLADDAEDNILDLYHAFRNVGIPNPLFVVYDGRHAIDYLAGSKPFEDRRKYPLPRLVLLSTDLSGKTGMEVLQWMRLESAGIKELPVVLLASSANKPELRQAIHLGANDYILKSFDFEEKVEWAKVLKKSCLS